MAWKGAQTAFLIVFFQAQFTHTHTHKTTWYRAQNVISSQRSRAECAYIFTFSPSITSNILMFINAPHSKEIFIDQMIRQCVIHWWCIRHRCPPQSVPVKEIVRSERPKRRSIARRWIRQFNVSHACSFYPFLAFGKHTNTAAAAATAAHTDMFSRYIFLLFGIVHESHVFQFRLFVSYSVSHTVALYILHIFSMYIAGWVLLSVALALRAAKNIQYPHTYTRTQT